MPNELSNWTFREVERFLKQKGFALHHTNGSHYYYKGVAEGEVRNVCVPFHGQTAIKPRTLKGIIQQSGISRKSWMI